MQPTLWAGSVRKPLHCLHYQALKCHSSLSLPQVSFRNKDECPIAILTVQVEPRPHVIDRTFRFYHAEQSFLKKTIRLPPWRSLPGNITHNEIRPTPPHPPYQKMQLINSVVLKEIILFFCAARSKRRFLNFYLCWRTLDCRITGKMLGEWENWQTVPFSFHFSNLKMFVFRCFIFLECCTKKAKHSSQHKKLFE